MERRVVNVNVDLHHELKVLAAQLNTPMQELVESALIIMLDGYKEYNVKERSEKANG